MKRRIEDGESTVVIESFEDLLQAIENNIVENELRICGAGAEEGSRTEHALDDDKVIRLVNALQKNTKITKLDLSCNLIGDRGAIALATLSTISELDVESNNIGITGATALANGKFKKLNLGMNRIGYNSNGDITDDEKKALIEAFSANVNLEKVNLNTCDLNTEHHGEMISKIIVGSSIKILNLDFNDLVNLSGHGDYNE